MEKCGPIILVDDDQDDLEMMQQVFTELDPAIETIAFNDGVKFLDFMRATPQRVFFILCDINMPGLNGLQLQRQIYEDERLRLKCIPFVFFSTSDASSLVMQAYSYGVQGYFLKPANYAEMRETFTRMVKYWEESRQPRF